MAARSGPVGEGRVVGPGVAPVVTLGVAPDAPVRAGGLAARAAAEGCEVVRSVEVLGAGGAPVRLATPVDAVVRAIQMIAPPGCRSPGAPRSRSAATGLVAKHPRRAARRASSRHHLDQISRAARSPSCRARYDAISSGCWARGLVPMMWPSP